MRRTPRRFVLPDLVSHCPYLRRSNSDGVPVARASESWLLSEANFAPERQTAFLGLRAGELTAACYPDADADHLQVASDFMNFLFTLDDWSDEFNAEDTHGLAGCVMRALGDPLGFETDKAAGKLAKSFFARYLRTAGPKCTRRFIDTMYLFFRAVAQQAQDRARGDISSLEEYIALRWDTSGCKPCFALIEYAAGIDLPDEVISHPMIRALEEATNSFVTWSNDIFSYNVEQARRDSHNMIAVIMYRHGLSLQDAVNFVGDLCRASIDRFEQDRRLVPSWGPKIDRDVAVYVEGLQNWIVGSLHWSFESTRYFGQEGASIKKHRVVKLLPTHDGHLRSAHGTRSHCRRWPRLVRLLSNSRRAFSSMQPPCRPSSLPLS
ncbi:terpenoid synthase [Trametes punicea]|nr:terpenoid synthase [Trametes punicea]